MDFDDGLGPARLDLRMARVDPVAAAGMINCPRSGIESCVSEPSRQGYTVTVVQTHQDSGTRVMDWRATLLDPSGWLVQADEWNASIEQPGQASRSAPPISVDLLKALVTHDQGWASVQAGAAPFAGTPTTTPPAAGQ
jgi:hypothetical protein